MDDWFTTIHRNKIEEFYEHMNIDNPNIQFISEKEANINSSPRYD